MDGGVWDGGWEGDFVEGVNELATAGGLVTRVWGAGLVSVG